MRILIAFLLFACFYAKGSTTWSERLEREMELLSQKAFVEEDFLKEEEELMKEEAGKGTKNGYFQRKIVTKDKLPGEVIDLDQVYFSDSVSTKAAAPVEKKSSN